MKIKFVPTGQEIEATPNKSLLQMCVENKIEIKSICKGVPSCAECRIKIVEGEHNILPPSKAEISLIGSSYFIDQRRLSCQVRCFGDITVDITEQLERAETNSKKIRGFRAQHQKGSHIETQAKQGTMVLDEAPLPPPVQQPRQQQQGQGQGGGGGGGRGGQGGGGGRNRNGRGGGGRGGGGQNRSNNNNSNQRPKPQS
jgi:2Fe-2S ferredoxin